MTTQKRGEIHLAFALFTTLCIAQQNLSEGVNVVCDGSPSRMRMVRRISLGITTRPKSSIRRTIPVAFIYTFLLFISKSLPLEADSPDRGNVRKADKRVPVSGEEKVAER